MSAEAFMADLAAAERPGILVGGGAHKSRAAIVGFAERFGIPMFRTWNALDVVTDDSRVYAGTVGTYGGPGRNFGLQNTDVLLIIGCRISGRITGGSPQSFARGASRYWVDLDADLLREHEVQPHHSIRMDAGEFIAECRTGEHANLKICFPDWLARCRGWVKNYNPVRSEHFKTWHAYGAMHRLSEALPADAIVVYDTGGNSIMMGQCFKTKRGQRIFSSNGNTPMGFSLCGAIGAWFAEPHRPVFAIIGDGGMSLNIQELQTIAHYGARVKVFIFNNHILGNTKGYQRVNKKPEIACGPDGYSAPDFVKVANAYGIEAVRLDTWAFFEETVGLAIATDKPMVVDVVHHDFCTYEPRISSFDLPIEDMYPYLPREEFKKNMWIEPWKGWETNK